MSSISTIGLGAGARKCDMSLETSPNSTSLRVRHPHILRASAGAREIAHARRGTPERWIEAEPARARLVSRVADEVAAVERVHAHGVTARREITCRASSEVDGLERCGALGRWSPARLLRRAFAAVPPQRSRLALAQLVCSAFRALRVLRLGINCHLHAHPLKGKTEVWSVTGGVLRNSKNFRLAPNRSKSKVAPLSVPSCHTQCKLTRPAHQSPARYTRPTPQPCSRSSSPRT